MKQFWGYDTNGYIFANEDRNNSEEWEFLQEQLELLVLEDKAIKGKNVYYVSYENAAQISETDSEALGLPPVLPYQIEIKTQQGDLGHNDFIYSVKILQPDGEPFVNPVIYKGLVGVSSTRLYRLNLAQQKVVALAFSSNEYAKNYKGTEATKFNYTNLDKMGDYTKSADAKLEQELLSKSETLIVPEKISLDFKQEEEEYRVSPILWKTGKNGRLEPIKTDFSDVFQETTAIRSFYNDSNGKKFVCNEAVKAGLQKIKNMRKLTEEEYERYSKQPKELFDEEVFVNPEDYLTDIVSYSDRVDGLTDAKYVSTGFNSGYTTEWMPKEGESAATVIENIEDKDTDDNTSDNEDGSTFPVPEPIDGTDIVTTAGGDEPSGNNKGEDGINVRDRMKVLNIKPNIERIDYVKNFVQARDIDFKNALKEDVVLLAHQKNGIRWMLQQWQNGANGILLADDMGLGKTIQALGFIAGIKASSINYAGVEAPILIVAPIALLENWKNEYYKFVRPGIFGTVLAMHGNAIGRYKTGKVTPNGKKRIDFSSVKNNDIVLTTYETLRDYQFSFGEKQWSFIVVDEAQKIKNPTVGVTYALKAMKYDFAITLTGTPVENSWVDLWSIMDFAQPAYLGDLKTFETNFTAKLKYLNNDEKAITKLGEKLKQRLEPIFKRRMKKDHLTGLPLKTITKCPAVMPEYQRIMYNNVLNEAREKEARAFAIIAKLRDVSLHPDLCSMQLGNFYTMAPWTVINRSARLSKTFEILSDIKSRNEKALIFVVSRNMQLILSHLINSVFGVKINQPVNGAINGVARQRIVDKFNGGTSFDVLILSPEAAGVGLNITSANNVIHLGRMWNPAKEDQATDRVYRIGQCKNVNVYIPMATHPSFGENGSFDEKLDILLEYKRTLSDNVLFPTSENKGDIVDLFKDLTAGQGGDKAELYWSIEHIDVVQGFAFERIITSLYNKMPEWEAKQTPNSNDNGADVIVINQISHEGLLIQCKQTSESYNMGPDGVEAVYSSVNYYKKLYPGYKFKPVVITNAADFTMNAKIRAKVNGVELIARTQLADLLQEYPVVREF